MLVTMIIYVNESNLQRYRNWTMAAVIKCEKENDLVSAKNYGFEKMKKTLRKGGEDDNQETRKDMEVIWRREG